MRGPDPSTPLRGQAILAVEVILGYVLLWALVTRFAVLFTAGGMVLPLREV
jgi:hypothetical protein